MPPFLMAALDLRCPIAYNTATMKLRTALFFVVFSLFLEVPVRCSALLAESDAPAPQYSGEEVPPIIGQSVLVSNSWHIEVPDVFVLELTGGEAEFDECSASLDGVDSFITLGEPFAVGAGDLIVVCRLRSYSMNVKLVLLEITVEPTY